MTFHATLEACLADRATSCRVFVMSTTRQTLETLVSDDARSVLDVAYYLYGTLVSLMFALCATLFAFRYRWFRLFGVFSFDFKVAH